MLANLFMNIIDAHNLACPIDGKSLEHIDKQFVCENGHTYDIARQGYVNLLPVQYKRSKEPGDSKVMVSARTQFLDTGVYQPIGAVVNELVLEQIINDKDVCIMDAGCGEGYYFNSLLNFLSDDSRETNLSLVGLDISKDAIIQSTKRNKRISWVVGTNRQPPVLEKSVDIILCMFGFLSIDAFSKLLKPGGKIILVEPASRHLQELRKIIYPEVRTKSLSVNNLLKDSGFSLLKTEALHYNVKLSSNDQINQLLVMTPHFYRASKEGREAACKLQEIDITIDVNFSVLQKTSDA